ncbi:sensor histidine kinase [Paracraurococcus lichenis]|uniref:histidine kinase n=1 Tax=Paracraurococcus lichenis TaxID=3064888 RepID=A0ABT9DWZ5_9PROT|nr:sensor histidine kinase [Paracraurococcus sp. LOR1-02]MDO9708417.1 sensor histidine kinase [Paracraurococcus sp. LOR1-02]
MGTSTAAILRSTPTLRGRLLLLVAAVALPLLTLAALAVWRAYDGERSRIGERMTAQARSMAFSIDREFERAEALLAMLARAPVLATGDLAAVEAQMRSLSATLFDGEHLALTRPDGTQVLNTTWPPGSRRQGAPTSAAARETLATSRTVISDLYTGMATGRPTVAVVVPVQGPDGGPPAAYALNATIPLPRLARVLTEQGVPQGWVAAVLDRTGRIVARTARQDEMVGRPAMPAVIQAITGPGAEPALLMQSPTLDGVLSVVALGRAPRSGYWVALAAPDRAFSGPLRTALAQLLAIGAALLGTGLALAFALARRVRDSLRVLAELGATGMPTLQPAGLREVDDVAQALAAAERQRRVLVAELNHRVKNVLATVQSVALQTLKGRAGDAAGFATALSSRLRALAAAHDLITAGSWEAAPLGAVVRGALAPWLAREAPGRIRIELPEEAARVGPLQAQALVLALNELATNAVKYGALSVPEGRIILRCATTEGGVLRLAWTETGGPPPATDAGEPPRQGFGTRLLRRALAQDLGPGARVDLRFAPTGLLARIEFLTAA